MHELTPQYAAEELEHWQGETPTDADWADRHPELLFDLPRAERDPEDIPFLEPDTGTDAL